MQYTTILAALALGSTTAMAHMEMSFPPPLKSKFNSHAKNADYSMTAPLSGVAQFPCKGYQTAMSDTTGEGASVVTWAPGAKANFTVVGGATHSGGSCQAALSYDVGKTFTVIHSYIGNCPTSSGQNFDFTIPSDAKTGSALFAWTWYNKVGNREIYMNCASVTIGAASAKRTISERDTAFSSRPGLFVANVDPNGCHSVEGTDLAFPDPGPDLTGTAGATGTISGTCVAVNGIGGPSSGSSSGSGTSASAPAASGSSAPSASPAASGGSTASSAAVAAPIASSVAASSGFSTLPVSSAAAGGAAAGSATATASAPASSGTGTSGSLTVSSHGECGASSTCAGQTQFGACCSKWNFCGDTTEHCGDGCQAGFGTCGSGASSGNSTTNATVKARQPRHPNLGFLRGRRARF
ncbi:hypothetical protein LHYA1_G007209 [Lachnellula hyalina]|uniref:Chitin-binding type-1 domain-containing protein n=1 Tax=Lachnellula hyalina TaxID=1316788 RepID=A0A8H8TXU8_9HELO|nr:uncharacterized protein LHYA1_G007209 [Lachnellula hyalina]TVY23306.1 hypothetical protein LHYA1_G007209 [Lachnellula hyalina]